MDLILPQDWSVEQMELFVGLASWRDGSPEPEQQMAGISLIEEGSLRPYSTEAARTAGGHRRSFHRGKRKRGTEIRQGNVSNPPRSIN